MCFWSKPPSDIFPCLATRHSCEGPDVRDYSFIATDICVTQSSVSGTNPPNTAELATGQRLWKGLGNRGFCSLDTRALSACHTNISGQPLTHGIPLSQGPLTVTPLDWQLSLCLPQQGGGGYLGAAITPVLLGQGMDGVRLCSEGQQGNVRSCPNSGVMKRLSLAERQKKGFGFKQLVVTVQAMNLEERVEGEIAMHSTR